jgi:ubiquinone/menaquinone biosynthesis C-methylase UbiE
MLPLDPGTFDVVVADHTLLALPDHDRAGALAEFLRVLRPGGRLLWIERQPRGGVFGAAQPSHAAADNTARERALSAAGFRGARTLAAAEGRAYVEGIKASQ